MTLLLDTSLWIDFTRARSPTALKQFIAPLEAQFATLPTLPTWRHGAQPRSAGGRRGPAQQRRAGELRRRLRGDRLSEWAAPEAPAAPCLTPGPTL